MPEKLWPGAALVVLSVAFAGCTGSFQVEQTEPIRVQIDGPPQQARVTEEDDQPKRFKVEQIQADSIEIEVEVEQVSSAPCTIRVTVQDASNVTLVTKEITVGGAGGGNATPANTTTNQTASPSPTGIQGGQTVMETIVVNVKGKDNVVVITQAEQGSADVNVAAREAGSTEQTGAPTGSPTASPTTAP